jgi:hypothetical protein
MRKLLVELFNHDFTDGAGSARFHARFFDHTLTLQDLEKVFAAVHKSQIQLGGKTIPSAVLIKGKKSAKPFAILAQLHGNEPAGLAGILLAMALSATDNLEHDVIGIIGNPLAAEQYFKALASNPKARQETRDAYRCGLSKKGELLPDMNRIPADFLTRPATDAHTKRAQELYTVAQHIGGILDIHSARGNMICITDHKHDRQLQDSPIRSVLTNLAEAISANASAAVTVQTFKTIAGKLPTLESQTGIESGRHESPEAPYIAASFTLSLLHTLGLTKIEPIYGHENGVFNRYSVQPRITYNDLPHEDTLQDGDKIYMAKSCANAESIPKTSAVVIVRKDDGDYKLQPILEFLVSPAGELAYAVCQYDEMEPIAKDQVVAVAVPSGTTFAAPSAFSGIFLSKSAALYDKDPAVGPWPVAPEALANVKFCYPCQVDEMKVKFDYSTVAVG